MHYLTRDAIVHKSLDLSSLPSFEWLVFDTMRPSRLKSRYLGRGPTFNRPFMPCWPEQFRFPERDA